MRKLILIAAAMLLALPISAQKLAVKNNLIYDAALTPNLALEIGLSEKMTLDLTGGYNWYELDKDKNKMFKHWLAQPELRFWTCEKFNGFFWGVHLHGGQFNIANTRMPFGMFDFAKHKRYEGYFYGGGVSVGNQWIIGKKWNLEASIGAGYARYSYDQFGPDPCDDIIKSKDKNYWGITRATVSFVYFFK